MGVIWFSEEVTKTGERLEMHANTNYDFTNNDFTDALSFITFIVTMLFPK